ncbi:hypothetical protein SOPP22_10745 [Shewanella sp. OPT22]|nr:hypothetical protein SOPP22_10745 [Shewanella sp. OPT22]
MQNQNRRDFLLKGGVIIATGAIAGTTSLAIAGPVDGEHHEDIKSNVKHVCATCSHWGGERKVSMDKKMVHVHGEGWCNHDDSEHHHTKTPPMKVHKTKWEKWDTLK